MAAGTSTVAIVLVMVVVLVLVLVSVCYFRGIQPKTAAVPGNIQDGLGGHATPTVIEMKPNKLFHSKDPLQHVRQNAKPSGSRKNSLDPPEEPFYNGGSMISAASGISALSDEDEAMSCPPSPAVSDYQEGEEGDKMHSSILVDDELIGYNPPTSNRTQPVKKQDRAFDPIYHQTQLQLDQPKHLTPDSLVKEKGGPSSYVGHTHTEYLELTQYRVNDSAYIDGSACASQTTTVSTTGSHDPHTARSSQWRALSPTPCLSDFTNYEIFYEMYRSQITPECVKPTATLSECTNKGVKYYDEANDFSLEIPEGAIPEGETVTIDIGVALYGPFQYPEGLRPVSPVFWLCVRDKKLSQFLKPVTVTIPHFLDLENLNDIESLGLTFLKGDHEMNSQQMYQFQRAEGNVLFEPLKKHGVLQTTHFCYLCITSKISLKLIRKAMFCVYAAIPRAMSPREPAYVYFFVTFLLSTYLDTLKNQIRKIPELHNHITKKRDFKFSKCSRDPALGIILSPSTPPEWTVGLQFYKEVCS